MAAEALPAPITINRPSGAFGRKGGTQSAGCAAAMAASNILINSSLGSMPESIVRSLVFSTGTFKGVRRWRFRMKFIENIGRETVWALDFLYALFSFMGMTFSRIARNFLSPARFRFPSIARHIYETGVRALPT